MISIPTDAHLAAAGAPIANPPADLCAQRQAKRMRGLRSKQRGDDARALGRRAPPTLTARLCCPHGRARPPLGRVCGCS